MTSSFDSALPWSGCHASSGDPHADAAIDAVWRSVKAALPSLGSLQRAALGIYGRLEPDKALIWTVEELGELLRLLLTDGTLSSQNLRDAALGPDDWPEIGGP